MRLPKVPVMTIRLIANTIKGKKKPRISSAWLRFYTTKVTGSATPCYSAGDYSKKKIKKEMESLRNDSISLYYICTCLLRKVLNHLVHCGEQAVDVLAACGCEVGLTASTALDELGSLADALADVHALSYQ